MKKVLSLILVFYSINFYSQEENKEDSVEINFIRTTGFAGSAQAFKTFIDSTFVCKLNNNKYSIHLVKPGIHTFSVQFGGKKLKEKAEKFELLTESNKKYYIGIMFETGLFINNTYCQEITETTAKRKMEKLTEDKDCK